MYCHNNTSIPPNIPECGSTPEHGGSRRRGESSLFSGLLWQKENNSRTSFPGLKPYELLDLSPEIPDSGSVEKVVCGILQNNHSISDMRPSDKISAFDCNQQNFSLECTHSELRRKTTTAWTFWACLYNNKHLRRPRSGQCWGIRGQQAIQGKGPPALEGKSRQEQSSCLAALLLHLLRVFQVFCTWEVQWY